MKTRVIELSVNNRENAIILPVNPSVIEFTEKQLNQTVTLLNVGETNLTGHRGLKYAKFTSFFPSEKSPYYKLADRLPEKYIATLQEWKRASTVVRLIVTDMDFNLVMLIDELDYSMKEGDGDIYYTISLSEYRYLNVPAINTKISVRSNGLKARPNGSGDNSTAALGGSMWNDHDVKYISF